ncbi:hypothetical protein H9Y13_18605 [Aeromonas veronii]|uniref:hypothetical protein n=1 Tax=Aeromonas TaxID=642 RepID=UPI0022EACD68|nr:MULTISPECIES: hypothetical protein [Aeromonas]KAJ8740025.1 hypothetical protein H9Y13_18605 [Aeromonas veronii]MDA3317841.1 hypothetical protein [Aeromonas sp. PI_26]
MADAAVITRRTLPSHKDAHKYLQQQGYFCIGQSWMRGERGYARIEPMASGGVKVIEGVA